MKRPHKVKRHNRTIKIDICADQKCEFYGTRTQQGVCFSDEGEVAMFAALAKHEQELKGELDDIRKREGKQYVQALEAQYLSAMMNWQLTLDECIRLRRDLAMKQRKR